MDNCTKTIFKFVNHTHTHEHKYSHAVDMKVITGIGVGLCALVTVIFFGWVVIKKYRQRRERQQDPIKFGLGFLPE